MCFKWYKLQCCVIMMHSCVCCIFDNFFSFKFQIQDGEIYATINQKDGMVRFLEDPEQYKTCEMIDRIDSSIHRYGYHTDSLKKFMLEIQEYLILSTEI